MNAMTHIIFLCLCADTEYMSGRRPNILRTRTRPMDMLVAMLDSTISLLSRFNILGASLVQSWSKWSWSATAFVIAVIFARTISNRPRRKLPPGPPRLPLFGNLFQLSGDAWLLFTKWKDVYGPITYLSLAGQPVVVLNTHKAVADLLDRRSGIYSDRPRNIVASEILTGGFLVVFTRFGDLWRKMRRAAHEGLNRGVAPNFHGIQTTEAVLLTHGLLNEPDDWDLHFRRTAASGILSIVYDFPPLKSAHDPRIKKINDFVQRLTNAAYPGTHFVEFFTLMEYLPGFIAKWKREAQDWYRKDTVMFTDLYGSVERRVMNGDNRPSFSATLALQKERHGLTTVQSSYLAGTMYAAGAETTSAVLAWFMHAMLLYPEVQRKAQLELDAVVGISRLPAFSDYESLPYIRALVKESLRFRPVDPVGLPHRLMQDDWYEGYLIPAGTICIANVWGLNRDPDVYGPDAASFNPARYLDANGQIAPAPPDTKEEGHVTYGFGRRICVGRYIANNTLFIDIATILWGLNLAPIEDVNGSPVLPLVDECIHDGLVVRPVPFKCSITPRFPGVNALLTQTKDFHEQYIMDPLQTTLVQ